MPTRHHTPRMDRRNPAIAAQQASRDYCSDCDRPEHECRCMLTYLLTRVDETGRTCYAKRDAGGTWIEVHTQRAAEVVNELEAIAIMDRLNGDIYQTAHQWGIQHI